MTELCIHTFCSFWKVLNTAKRISRSHILIYQYLVSVQHIFVHLFCCRMSSFLEQSLDIACQFKYDGIDVLPSI